MPTRVTVPLSSEGLLQPTDFNTATAARVAKSLFRTGLVVALLSSTVACATGPGKTPSELQADKETADRVASALDADRFLFARHISVRAESGVVHLEGYVWSPSDIYAAKRIASRVPGVTLVVDELELERAGLD